MFERTCFAIEEYSTILYSLSKELDKFHINILKPNNPENVLSKFNKNKNDLLYIMKLDDLYFMEENDRKIIEEIRNQFISNIQDFNSQLLAFMNHNWLIFNKMKHGNTLI